MRIDKIINESINNFILNEINHIAQKSPITICSLEEFVEICGNDLKVNDTNVEQYVGDYAFIEIGSSIDRCIFDYEYSDSDRVYKSGEDFYNNGQYYFKENHMNVLHLEFDDNIKVGKSDTDEDNGMNTPVRLSKSEVSPRHWKKEWSDKHKPTFRYNNAKGFNYEQAKEASEFIQKNIDSSENGIKFIIHCRQGRSRSAALGYYLAKRLEQDIRYKINMIDYFKEYDIDYGDGTKSNQFNIYQTSDKNGKLMNHRVSSILFDYDANKDDYAANPSEYTYIKRNGKQAKGKLLNKYKKNYQDSHNYSIGNYEGGIPVSKRRK